MPYEYFLQVQSIRHFKPIAADKVLDLILGTAVELERIL